MSIQPAFRPDQALPAAPHGMLRDPRQAVLFFGHALDTPDLVVTLDPANDRHRSDARGMWRRVLSACERFAVAASEALLTWRERAAGRRDLAGLDARLRKDIGLTAVDAWYEANKPFWRA